MQTAHIPRIPLKKGNSSAFLFPPSALSRVHQRPLPSSLPLFFCQHRMRLTGRLRVGDVHRMVRVDRPFLFFPPSPTPDDSGMVSLFFLSPCGTNTSTGSPPRDCGGIFFFFFPPPPSTPTPRALPPFFPFFFRLAPGRVQIGRPVPGNASAPFPPNRR